MTRRDALRAVVLAVIASPLVAACGDVASGSRRARAGVDLDLVESDLRRSAGDPGAAPDVVAALKSLAGDLWGELAEEPGNLVLSPYSIAVALAMTLPGAGGRTATEMREVLGVTDDARFHGGLNALTAHVDGLAGLQDRSDGTVAEVALDGANQLYGQQGVGWEREFLDLLARQYGAGIRTVDYENAPEQARALINDWVAGRTQDQIPELVPAGVIDDLTRLVLVNALYLKAPWEFPFDRTRTQARPFHRANASPIDVDTMVQPGLATTLTHGDGWRAVRLPYAGRTLAMTLVLPDPGRMGEVTRLLTSGEWADVMAAGQPAQLDLQVPRWTFRTSTALNQVLQRLGMEAPFDPDKADFSLMTDENLELHIRAVLHEGFIAVDEDGTEAAAATAVVIQAESAPPPAEPFYIDRPFVFVIHDVEHGTPLFLGRVDDPSG